MTTAEEIVKYMPGWRAEALFEGGDYVEASAKLVRAVDDATVTVTLDSVGTRFEINAGWPRYSDGTRFHPERYLKISVSAKKTAEAIAGDIERRLLPDYLPAYAKAVSDIKTREAEQAAAQRCAEHLGSIVGAVVHENGRGGFGLYETMPECITKVNVRTGLRVSMELTDLDEITATRILTLLQKREEALDEANNRTAEIVQRIIQREED